MRLLSVLIALVLLLLVLLLLLWPRGPAESSGAATRRADAIQTAERSSPAMSSTMATAAAEGPSSELTAAAPRPDGFGLIRIPECWIECGAPCVPDETGTPVCPPECEQDEDCGSDALCRVTRPRNPAIREFRCLSTQCATDADCGPDEACDVNSNWHATIGLCRWAGTRRAGEPCAGDLYTNPAGYCARGLHCSSGVCGLNRCETDSECGVGQRCQLIANLPYRMCLPYCESDADCAAGWVCYSDDGMMPRCMRRDALGCQTSGCPAGQECKVRFGLGSYHLTECVRPCDADAACDPGEQCARVLADDRTSCRRPCESDEDCPERWMCRPATDLSGREIQACLPQLDAHEDLFYETFDKGR